MGTIPNYPLPCTEVCEHFGIYRDSTVDEAESPTYYYTLTAENKVLTSMHVLIHLGCILETVKKRSHCTEKSTPPSNLPIPDSPKLDGFVILFKDAIVAPFWFQSFDPLVF